MVGLYEQAQACTMVLPRLYLLNTVGACYILSQEAPARVRTSSSSSSSSSRKGTTTVSWTRFFLEAQQIFDEKLLYY